MLIIIFDYLFLDLQINVETNSFFAFSSTLGVRLRFSVRLAHLLA